MRICFLHHTYPGIGGTETVTNLLGNNFNSYGYEVSVLAWHKPDESLEQTFPVEYLPDDKTLNSDINTFFIYSYIEKRNIDCLINQGPFWIPKRNPKECRTVIISVLHYAPAYKIENQKNSIIENFRKESPNLSDGIKSSVRYLFKNFFAKRDFRLLYKPELDQTILNSDCFVVLCPQYKKELQLLMNKQYRNLFSIGNGLDIGKTHNYYNKDKIVVVVGRLTKWDKRVDRILKVWHELQEIHPKWKLQILGDGPEKNNLLQLAKSLELKNYEFVGFVNIHDYMHKASILAMTSSSEGFPMVILEAYKYGVVPIAYNVSGGISHLINDGETGILIKPFCHKEYVNKLATLMTDKTLRDRMLDKISEGIHNFDINLITNKWIELIERLSKNEIFD